MDWSRLPEVPLSSAFSHLELRDKLSVWNTCSRWRYSLERLDSWPILEFSWWKLLYENPEGIIPHNYEFLEDFDKCMNNCGNGIRDVATYLCVDEPNGYEVLETISRYCCNIRTLSISKYVVADAKPTDIMSDQRFTAVIKELFKKNTKLKGIRVRDCQFDVPKNDLLPFGLLHSDTLVSLDIVNSFKGHSLSNIMWMVNMTELTINPKHLNFSLLKHLNSHSLKDLRIVSNCERRDFYFEAMSEEQWHIVRECGPKLKVHCYVLTDWSNEWTNFKTFFKRNMPLYTLVMHGGRSVKTLLLFGQFLCNYKDTLEEFVDFAPNTKYIMKCPEGDLTIDEFVIEVIHNCRKLTTLALNEVLNAKTITNIANSGEQLVDLLIQKNKINFCNENGTGQSMDMKSLCTVVSSCLGVDWKPLTESILKAQFKDRYGSYVFTNNRNNSQ